MATKLIAKASARSICGDVSAIMKDVKEGEVVELFQATGVMRGEREGQGGPRGSWKALTGKFTVKRLADGAEFITARLFLPEQLQDFVAADLYRADSERPVPRNIDVKLSARKESRTGGRVNNFGYVYEVELGGEKLSTDAAEPAESPD